MSGSGHPGKRPTPCRFFSSGNCVYGDNCRNLHQAPSGIQNPYQNGPHPMDNPGMDDMSGGPLSGGGDQFFSPPFNPAPGSSINEFSPFRRGRPRSAVGQSLSQSAKPFIPQGPMDQSLANDFAALNLASGIGKGGGGEFPPVQQQSSLPHSSSTPSFAALSNMFNQPPPSSTPVGHGVNNGVMSDHSSSPSRHRAQALNPVSGKEGSGSNPQSSAEADQLQRQSHPHRLGLSYTESDISGPGHINDNRENVGVQNTQTGREAAGDPNTEERLYLEFERDLYRENHFTDTEVSSDGEMLANHLERERLVYLMDRKLSKEKQISASETGSEDDSVLDLVKQINYSYEESELNKSNQNIRDTEGAVEGRQFSHGGSDLYKVKQTSDWGNRTTQRRKRHKKKYCSAEGKRFYYKKSSHIRDKEKGTTQVRPVNHEVYDCTTQVRPVNHEVYDFNKEKQITDRESHSNRETPKVKKQSQNKVRHFVSNVAGRYGSHRKSDFVKDREWVIDSFKRTESFGPKSDSEDERQVSISEGDLSSTIRVTVKGSNEGNKYHLSESKKLGEKYPVSDSESLSVPNSTSVVHSHPTSFTDSQSTGNPAALPLGSFSISSTSAVACHSQPAGSTSEQSRSTVNFEPQVSSFSRQHSAALSNVGHQGLLFQMSLGEPPSPIAPPPPHVAGLTVQNCTHHMRPQLCVGPPVPQPFLTLPSVFSRMGAQYSSGHQVLPFQADWRQAEFAHVARHQVPAFPNDFSHVWPQCSSGQQVLTLRDRHGLVGFGRGVGQQIVMEGNQVGSPYLTDQWSLGVAGVNSFQQLQVEKDRVWQQMSSTFGGVQQSMYHGIMPAKCEEDPDLGASLPFPSGLSPNHSPGISPSGSPHMFRRNPNTSMGQSHRQSTIPQKQVAPIHQENVGGTTYFYNPDDFTPQSEGLTLPPFNMFHTTPAYLKHMKLKGPPTFFMADEIKAVLLARQTMSYAACDPASEVPQEVDNYDNLIPLERTASPNAPIKSILGYPSTCYRATHKKEGALCVLRRIHNFRLNPSLNSKLMTLVETWNKLYHPNIVQLREAFTTKAFGDHSVVVSYDYLPGAETLMAQKFSNIQAINGFTNEFSGNSRSSFSNQGGGQNGTSKAPSEAEIWMFIVQLCSALRCIHGSGLAARTIEPTKILQYGRGRLHVNCVGVMDILTLPTMDQGNLQNYIQHWQQEDLTGLGRIVLALACNSALAVQSQNFNHAMEMVSRNYSADLKNLIGYLFETRKPRSVNDLMPMIGARFFTQLDHAQLRGDMLLNELSKEVENGRLCRLMMKLLCVLERPEFSMDTAWSETGDRYMLKLFRDYVFHSVDEQGLPWMDMSHMILCLNKLDAGVSETIVLSSRDESSVFIVSYAELKRQFTQAFHELMTAGQPSYA